MTTEIVSHDGSCDKLLDDSERCSQDEEEDEDCIGLLLSSLEKDANEVSENLAERKRKILAEDREADTELKVYLKQKYGNSLDHLDDSVNGSVSDLNTSLIKLEQTTSNVTSNGTRNTNSKRGVPAAVLHREKLAMKLLKKHKSETGKVVCGIAIILIILGIGGSLLFLAFMFDMEDLYILGGIFSLGGIAFTIVFIIVRCQAIEQLEDTDYSVLYKA